MDLLAYHSDHDGDGARRKRVEETDSRFRPAFLFSPWPAFLFYTDDFLRSKGNYEIQKLQFTEVVRPIISKTPNERWSMDLINMSVGNTHTYIFSLVDNFSGFYGRGNY